MLIEPQIEPKDFADADHGALLIAVFGRRNMVRGVKAYHAGEGGAREDFFVTVGPFLAEHGDRPVVYRPDDLGDSLVIDVTASQRLWPSFAFDDLLVEQTTEKALGMILFDTDGRAWMRIANFGRAGSSQVSFLDVTSGQIADLPEDAYLMGSNSWRIIATDENGQAVTVAEYKAEISD